MMSVKYQVSRFTQHTIGFTSHVSRITFLLFLVALLPRLYSLGSFMTIDEVKWAEGAAQFLMALRSGDLAQTYWHFFPGITIAWGSAAVLWGRCLGAADLAECAQASIIHLPDTIGWLRLAPVLFTSLGIVGVYLLARRWLSERAAVVGALLLAFDPFFIAHSRILNGDAVAAILMFLSLLAFLSYLSGESANQQVSESTLRPSPFTRHHSLLISGLLAGLAVLTKLPAPIIGVFIGGLGGIAMLQGGWAEGWPGMRRWLAALLLWGVLSLTAIWLLWPALWVAPSHTLQHMYADAFEVGGAGTGHDTFYLGQIVADPGPWFYPHAIAFRLTPVTMIGLVFIIASLAAQITFYILRFKESSLRLNLFTPTSKIVWTLLAYIVFVILLANASPKKLDRYVMAVIPPLVFLAALGWTQLGELGFAWLRCERLKHPSVQFTLWGGLAGLQLLFAILAAPYYLTYYNPLLGGVQQAARQVPVGWGEGLEQAAHYLNALPEAQNLKVSSWYGDMFEPYFTGQRASFADDGRAQLAADYVVFYINQIERQKPYPGLIDFFRATRPVFQVMIGPQGQVTQDEGVPWVEVYQAPAAQSASGAPKVEGVAQLLAYKIVGARAATSPKMDELALKTLSRDELLIHLYLRVLGPLPPDSDLNVALMADSSSQSIATAWRHTEMKGQWHQDTLVERVGILTLPSDTPAGDYRLRLTLQTSDHHTLAEWPLSNQNPPLQVQ